MLTFFVSASCVDTLEERKARHRMHTHSPWEHKQRHEGPKLGFSRDLGVFCRLGRNDLRHSRKRRHCRWYLRHSRKRRHCRQYLRHSRKRRPLIIRLCYIHILHCQWRSSYWNTLYLSTSCFLPSHHMHTTLHLLPHHTPPKYCST